MPEKKSKFWAGPTNKDAEYTMSFICGEDGCGKPGTAYSDDKYGMYVGTCAGGHEVTVMAS